MTISNPEHHRLEKRLQKPKLVGYLTHSLFTLLDLSEHGMCAITQNKFEKGNIISIDFQFPSNYPNLTKIQAEVIECTQLSMYSCFKTHFRFILSQSKVQSYIKEYIFKEFDKTNHKQLNIEPHLDKRKWSRKKTLVDASISYQGQPYLIKDNLIVNFSLAGHKLNMPDNYPLHIPIGGAKLQTKHTFPFHDIMLLKFTLLKKHFELPSVIRWTVFNEKNQLYDVGILFELKEKAAYEFMNSFIDSNQ